MNKANDQNSMNLQLWMNFALVPILILIIQIMRADIRKVASDCDERDISAADYTIMIEHISNSKQSGLDYNKELKQLIESQPPMKVGNSEIKFEVTKINLTYNLQEYYRYFYFGIEKCLSRH